MSWWWPRCMFNHFVLKFTWNFLFFNRVCCCCIHLTFSFLLPASHTCLARITEWMALDLRNWKNEASYHNSPVSYRSRVTSDFIESSPNGNQLLGAELTNVFHRFLHGLKITLPRNFASLRCSTNSMKLTFLLKMLFRSSSLSLSESEFERIVVCRCVCVCKNWENVPFLGNGLTLLRFEFGRFKKRFKF